VFAGVFDAYPRLKIILGHLGEGLPFAMHRLNEHSWAAAKRRAPEKSSRSSTCANNLVVNHQRQTGSSPRSSARCSRSVRTTSSSPSTGPTHERNKTGMGFLRQLSISDADKEKIAHRNAERLLGV